MKLEKYIPFESKSFRPYQKEAIEEIIQAIEDGSENILLNAPVGLGKSLIAYILASYYYDKDESTYFYTSTKYLQDQYKHDFEDINVVKGRSNFRCLSDPFFDCSRGSCKQLNKFHCPYGADVSNEVHLRENEDDLHCPYWEQKYEAIQAPISLLNYTYAFTDAQYLNHFPTRFLGVADEGHNIEKELMGLLETKLSATKLKKDIGYSLQTNVSKYTINEWSDILHDISSQYKGKSEDTEDKVKRDSLKERSQTIEYTANLLDNDSENWIVEGNTYNGFKTVVFKPIMVDRYSDLLFDKAEHNVIMSGSILKPDIFAKELGLDDFYYIEIPGIIPKQNRKIIEDYCGSMSSSNIENNFPNLAARIDMLSKMHSNEKGLIHTYTYRIANMLKKKFKRNPRFIFHDSQGRDAAFKKFKETDMKNAILVSPVAFEGVDFPYDEARWQAICKDPFPNIGDKQISTRDRVDYGWIYRQRCLVLSQMYGRTNRAPDDYSVTYLLDSEIKKLLGPKTLVTDYFLEAIDNLNYDKEFTISDNAEEIISNQRSENNIYEETTILNDIQANSFKTMKEVRQAYKNIKGDSYSYSRVIPVVSRLLERGALQYV